MRRGRGRGYNRGDSSLKPSHPTIPAIPPFPFHSQRFGNCGAEQRVLQDHVPPTPRLKLYVNPWPGQRFSLNHVSPAPRFPVCATNYRLERPQFPVVDRERNGPVRNHFIPSLPKPKANTLTQQDWDVLNLNGRPAFKGACVVVCCCTFGEGDALQKIFSFCCNAVSSSEHSEKKTIEQMVMLENGTGRELRKVILISSRSPCMNCAQDIVTFVKSREFSLNLYFTALQKDINPDKNGINLLAAFGIPMRVVDDNVWSYLTSLLPICEGKPRTTFSDGRHVSVINRKAWDEVWSCQLRAILHQDLPNIVNSQNMMGKFYDVRNNMNALALKKS